jgi:hypothetical protein
MDTNTRANLDAIGRSEYRAIQALLAAVDTAEQAEDDPAQEEAQAAIDSSALSVEVRSGWYMPGEDGYNDQPAEYRILLSWGGPAARIVGTLDIHGQPESAVLEVQDWGTPWTGYAQAEEAVLIRFASFFYYGG